MKSYIGSLILISLGVLLAIIIFGGQLRKILNEAKSFNFATEEISGESAIGVFNKVVRELNKCLKDYNKESFIIQINLAELRKRFGNYSIDFINADTPKMVLKKAGEGTIRTASLPSNFVFHLVETKTNEYEKGEEERKNKEEIILILFRNFETQSYQDKEGGKVKCIKRLGNREIIVELLRVKINDEINEIVDVKKGSQIGIEECK